MVQSLRQNQIAAYADLYNFGASQRAIIEEVFYFRPVGYYLDYKGNKYCYSEEERNDDIHLTWIAACHYEEKIKKGHAPEHARDLLTQNIRQHFVVTFSLRAFLHFCDMRSPMDAQPEIRSFTLMAFEKFKEWCPEIAEYYQEKRLCKNLLSP